MKKNKTVLLSISGLALAGLVLLATNKVYAYRGDYTQKGPDCTPEKHEVMEKVFENNDYSAWKEARGDRGRVSQVINEENFARFAEAHQLAAEGKYEEADQIRQELGLRVRNGNPVGAGFQDKNGQGYRQTNNQ